MVTSLETLHLVKGWMRFLLSSEIVSVAALTSLGAFILTCLAMLTTLTSQRTHSTFYTTSERSLVCYASMQSIPPLSRIVLPNARIIHGDDLITTSEDCNLSLVQLETHIGALVMPKLTEVTCGNVWFENTSSTASLLTGLISLMMGS